MRHRVLVRTNKINAARVIKFYLNAKSRCIERSILRNYASYRMYSCCSILIIMRVKIEVKQVRFDFAIVGTEPSITSDKCINTLLINIYLHIFVEVEEKCLSC